MTVAPHAQAQALAQAGTRTALPLPLREWGGGRGPPHA